MGHLAMSDRSSTTSVETSMSAAKQQQQTELKHRLTANGKSSAAANGFPAKNGQPLVSAVDGEVKNIEQKHHVDLEEYTKNFKGDRVFGIQFKAPLKWGNIIMISLLHLFFVYAYVTFPLDKLRVPSVLFGK
ncbi:uncharacterized protein LOC133329150 [Musca vetustissima]|uniref:uncharacterized protein LOC133329150 n=1 Tax=Musca vetustissima TaxID=27455 RepID=UPI002AB67199|nr:uncharacterized protein LOC133329150 [Musca vetustissima]